MNSGPALLQNRGRPAIDCWPVGRLATCSLILAALHLGEGLNDLDAFLIGEALDQGLLRFKTETGFALLLGRDADVGDCGLHGGLLHNTTDVDVSHVNSSGEVLQAGPISRIFSSLPRPRLAFGR